MEHNLDLTVDVHLDDRWSIGGKPHGGYLLRQLAEPVLTETHPHPMAVSAHFVRSPGPGPATVTVETLRTGRRVANSRARMSQGGEVCVEALITTGRYDADATPFWTDATRPPELLPVEECVASLAEREDGFRIGHLDFVDMRLDLSSYDTPGAEVRCWLRRTDEAPATMTDLLVFADALPPVTFGLGLTGWVPTVELTVLVRGIPAPGWLRAVQRATLLQDGWLDEECLIWDSQDRLVVQARQLAGYRA